MNSPFGKNFFQRISRSMVPMLTVAVVTTLSGGLPAFAQTETAIYGFCRLTSCADGSEANGSLIRDSSGNLYGTTLEGGAHNGGTVYKLTLKGTETVLYSFGASSDDGTYPNQGVTMDSHGNLCGVTEDAGSHNAGTVFKVTPDGAETILHTFTSSPSDGAYPFGPVILDAKGNIWGTTSSGGRHGYGTIFRISSGGVEAIVHSFDPSTGDGDTPFSGLVVDRHGNFYGTTTAGGTYNAGIVFELTSKGVYSILYNFGSNAGDGNTVNSSVILDAEGNVYGVTVLGGSSNNGIVFKLTPGSPWTETILYNFGGYSQSDGSQPSGPLVIDSEGNLYGTTYQGGNYFLNAGTVFEVSPAGYETVLYDFVGNADGAGPSGGLLRDSHGNLYGTAYRGGDFQNGVVYKVIP